MTTHHDRNNILKLRNLLRTGRITQNTSKTPHNVNEEEVSGALSLLFYTAKTTPPILRQEIEAVLFVNAQMITLALAVLCAYAPEPYINQEGTKRFVGRMVDTMTPPEIIEFVDYLRSKTLGRGFGSRPQKIIRSVMEKWEADTLELYILEYEKALKDLVRLVHPTYQDYRGELIKILFEK